MNESGRPPGFEDGAVSDDAPLLAPRVPSVLDSARDAGHFGGERTQVTVVVDAKLLATVRALTGLTNESDLLSFALAHVAWDADWLLDFERSRGTVDADLDLDF